MCPISEAQPEQPGLVQDVPTQPMLGLTSCGEAGTLAGFGLFFFVHSFSCFIVNTTMCDVPGSALSSMTGSGGEDVSSRSALPGTDTEVLPVPGLAGASCYDGAEGENGRHWLCSTGSRSTPEKVPPVVKVGQMQPAEAARSLLCARTLDPL